MDFRNDRRQFAGEAIGFGLRGGDGPAGPAALSIARFTRKRRHLRHGLAERLIDGLLLLLRSPRTQTREKVCLAEWLLQDSRGLSRCQWNNLITRGNDNADASIM